MTSDLTISVLIATCDRPNLIKDCLERLFQNSRPPDEIIVIDQSSDNDTGNVIKQLQNQWAQLRYERMERLGKACALNRAIELSTGNFLGLTDDDVTVSKTWLETFENVWRRHSGINAYCGRVLPEENTQPEDYINLVLSEEERWIDKKTNPISPAFCGANIFIRRGTMREFGNYNIRFGPGAAFRNNDDGELAYRLTRRGERILYAPELIVYHSGWRRERENMELVSDYAYGLAAFAGHYVRNGDLVPMLYLARKSIYKLTHLAFGIISFRKQIVIDEYLHLKGFLFGFMKGIVTS